MNTFVIDLLFVLIKLLLISQAKEKGFYIYIIKY